MDNSAGRIWIDEGADLLVRFKASPHYKEKPRTIRDVDGTDDDCTAMDSDREIQVKPLHNYRPDISWPVRSFDLGAGESCGYPKVAACARAMKHALEVAGHTPSVLVQLWASVDGKDEVQWQVEFRGQDDLGNAAHVQAMRTWLEAGAPIAFIARLTGNGLERLEAIVRPAVDMGETPTRMAIQRREPREDAWA
jgi:hypothetical protein